ncbi:hypothetical protein PFISCL1PPCAC_1413, partial [Pristionchus fissidentatus]
FVVFSTFFFLSSANPTQSPETELDGIHSLLDRRGGEGRDEGRRGGRFCQLFPRRCRTRGPRTTTVLPFVRTTLSAFVNEVRPGAEGLQVTDVSLYLFFS